MFKLEACPLHKVQSPVVLGGNRAHHLLHAQLLELVIEDDPHQFGAAPVATDACHVVEDDRAGVVGHDEAAKQMVEADAATDATVDMRIEAGMRRLRDHHSMLDVAKLDHGVSTPTLYHLPCKATLNTFVAPVLNQKSPSCGIFGGWSSSVMRGAPPSPFSL